MKKNLQYYRALPYTKRVDRAEEDDGETYFVARVDELPGCMATGETRPEALANLKEAFDEYIEAMLEWGDEIPEPSRAVPKARGGLYKYQKKEDGTAQGSGAQVIGDQSTGESVAAA